MADTTPNTTPQDPNEAVSFISYDQPSLHSGEYTIEVNQRVDLLEFLNAPLDQQVAKTIYVAGERFSIAANNIFTCFPPQGNTGDYTHTLPHISLTKTSLPWERYALQGNTMPWMWLLVYDDNDLARGDVSKQKNQPLSSVFRELRKEVEGKLTPVGKANANPLILQDITLEPGETPDTKVNVLSMTEQFLKEVFPTNEDLPLMSFVRQNKRESEIIQHAICMANRMPAPGVKSYACLLSLEDRLQTPAADAKTPLANLISADQSSGHHSFVILADWTFSCLDEQCYQTTPSGYRRLAHAIPPLPPGALRALDNISLPGFFNDTTSFTNALAEALGENWSNLSSAQQQVVLNAFKVPDRTFQGLMQGLSAAPLAVTEKAMSSQPIAKAYIESGAIPLEHSLHGGGKSISWYRGPFAASTGQSTGVLPTPVLSSDQLLQFDQRLNMLDVSYASAWELGKLLTLNNKIVAMDLYAWKRQQKWMGQEGTGLEETPAGTKEKNAVQSWVDRLRNLEHIPFNYLVPDERMLPSESIRYFTIDNFWISALLDGALSIGRVSANDRIVDQSTQVTFGLPIPPTTTVRGFFIRSEAITGWPNIQISVQSKNGDSGPVKPFSTRQIGPDISVFLFDCAFDTVDIHLPAEALHFGFDKTNQAESGPGYSKMLRFKFDLEQRVSSIAGKLPTVPISWKQQPTPGEIAPPYKTVDLAALNKAMCLQLPSTPEKDGVLEPAQFAFEMVEGVPHVVFSVEG